MISGVNKVILVGYLGKDPEMRYATSGAAIANMTIATSEQWTDKQSGQKNEKVEWHRVVMFNRLGEIAGEYLKKGSQVYIEGKLQTRKWQDKEGKDQYTTEIVANEMQMLGNKAGAGEHHQAPTQQNAPVQAAAPAQNGGNFDDFDDDIPF